MTEVVWQAPHRKIPLPLEAFSSRCIKVLTDRVRFMIGKTRIRPSHRLRVSNRLVRHRTESVVQELLE